MNKNYWLLLTLSLWPCAFAWGVENPVSTAEQALRSTRQPWYDAESDALRPVELDPEPAVPDRADWTAAERPRWDWNPSWGGLTVLGDLLKVLAWAALLLVIGVLIYALARTYWDLSPARTNAEGSAGREHALLEQLRIENLPVELRGNKGDFLAIARQQYQQGNFAEAIIYLFSYRLLQLDRVGLIRLTKGKTNRQYLWELRSTRPMRQLVAETMAAFEDVFFGGRDLTRERFERCWERNQQFSDLIKQVA